MSLLEMLYEARASKQALLARLVDPDAQSGELVSLEFFGRKADVILVGGSLASQGQTVKCIQEIRQAHPSVPLYLFPGSTNQLSDRADGILLLSLISGRNPDLLIGRHVEVALALKRSDLQVLPTGYMLIDSGKPTSVSYMSNTMPIPSTKSSLALATATAGELLGLKAIYLEAGSGAEHPVPTEMASVVARGVDIPVIVGGGVRSQADLQALADTGVAMVVVGTALEQRDLGGSHG